MLFGYSSSVVCAPRYERGVLCLLLSGIWSLYISELFVWRCESSPIFDSAAVGAFKLALDLAPAFDFKSNIDFCGDCDCWSTINYPDFGMVNLFLLP